MSNKILLTSNILWGFAFFRIDLIKELIRNGYDVTCAGDIDNFSKESINIIASAGAHIRVLKISRKGINPLREIMYLFNYYRIVKTENPGVIINYSIKPVLYGSFISYITRIPSVAIFPGLGHAFLKQNILNSLVKLFYKICLRVPEKVVFLNNDDIELFLNENIVSEKKVIYLPSEGINTSEYSPVGKCSNDQKVIFLLIARFFWEKGIGEYVEAAKIIKRKYSNVEFQLLGFIDYDNPRAIKIEQINEWVQDGYINYLGKTDCVKKVIKETDCVVLPSYYREGVPRSLLEAASMSKPIITSDTIGCRDVVDDGINGFLCKPKDVKDLVIKLEMMIEMSNEDRIKMGQKGREKIINKFAVEKVNEVYLNFINNILKS
jgi:glycosyltransferase involved in cell wall biosynthesis